MASCNKKRGATEKRHGTDDSENEDVQRESVPREKKKKYLQKFRKSYSEDFEHIASSTKGAEYAFCSKCNLHLSIGHGGQHDIRKHVNSESHKSHPLCGPQITRFFAPDKSKVENPSSTQSKLELDVIKAEATMCHFLTSSNLPLASADKLTGMMKTMFPDSKIAAGMSLSLSVP